MKHFLKQLLKFLSVILVLSAVLLSLYLVYDPFRVVYKYKSYYASGEPSYITLNRDYVSVETFLNNNPVYNYHSFIFGNSRSRLYEISVWSKLIGSDAAMHIDASGESLYGIYKKIEFLNTQNVHIDNALLILDYSTLLETNNSKGHLFIKHPLLSGQSNIDFQMVFLKAFCSFSFLPAFLDFKISGKIKKYMIDGHLLDDVPVNYDLKYNEMSYKQMEDTILSNPGAYYNKERMKRFFKRDTLEKTSKPSIKKEQLRMLNSINNIFTETKTQVRIVINPLYDQVKLNTSDILALKKIFGEENVYDFSGINSFTSDYHNYYEESHYRPHVADSIMRYIYRNGNAK